jgi:20S proteasome alpha/beta subunit
MLVLLETIANDFQEAQVNTQEYGRRPYGVGFLVIGQDQSGQHLYEFSPSGTSYEYYAMSIGARSQSAKTYLEKHFTEFAECESPFWTTGTIVDVHQVLLRN